MTRPLHVFQQAVDHGVDGDAVGLGPVAEQDAMPQGGMDQRADVFGRRRGTGPRSRARAFAPSTSDCPARSPAPQLTQSLMKSGASGPGRLAAASRTA